MDVREKLSKIVKRAAYLCLPSNTKDFHLDMFITDLIANGVTVQEWISVKDRLPEMSGKYLVYGRCFGNKAPQIWICEYICIGSVKGWCNDAKNPVVEAWTTLPQPPKGE